MSDEITPEAVTEKLKEKGIIEDTENSTDKPKVKEPNTVEIADDPNDDDDITLDVETTDVEKEAMAKGWKPEGEKSAEEFLRAEPLYEEIKQRGKELKTLRSQVAELTKHVGNLKKAGYQERIDIIKAEREDAVARSDIDSLDYLDEELRKVHTELSNEPETPNEPHPAALEFIEKHKDIINDYSLESQRIKEFMNKRDIELTAYNLDPEVHIKTLEKDLHTEFPTMFNKTEQSESEMVASVESDSRPVTSKRKSKYTFSDLNQEQKTICKYMERKGVMTGAEYIKQLIDIGELK